MRIVPADMDIRAESPTAIGVPAAWLNVLDDSVKHRGPDGAGRFLARTIRADGSRVEIGLVHRRLAILDRAGGTQPMVWPPESQRESVGSGAAAVAVIFNGCIYNHRELRRELGGLGHCFTSDHSDTEVLLHGWRHWREGLWARLDGMYAAAIWDGGRADWALGRDRFGEKPLYRTRFSHAGAAYDAVCSTAAGLYRLRRAAGAHVVCERVPLIRWLRHGYAPLSVSPLAGVEEVPPAEALAPTFSSGDDSQAGKPALTVPRADELIAAAVRSRLEADVPLGCFLSGGIDSPLIALHARRTLGSLRTFTVRMPDARMDESAAAAEYARVIGSDHYMLDCEATPAGDLASLIPQIGLPLGDSSLLPAAWVSRAARRHVSVALSGDGGDELFAGYARHRAWASAWRLRRLLGALPAGLLDAHDGRSRSAKLARLIRAARRADSGELAAIFPHRDLVDLAGPHPPECWAQTGPVRGPGAMLEFDRRWYLPFDLLRKTDSASMSCALEVRAPMLEPGLAGAAFGASLGELMPRCERKGLLKAVALRHFPAELVKRPKSGFAIPISEWFRSDFGGLRTMLLDHLRSSEPLGPGWLGAGDVIDRAAVERMIREHGVPERTGDRSSKVTRDHGQRLFALLTLSVWSRWAAGSVVPGA